MEAMEQETGARCRGVYLKIVLLVVPLVAHILITEGDGWGRVSSPCDFHLHRHVVYLEAINERLILILLLEQTLHCQGEGWRLICG